MEDVAEAAATAAADILSRLHVSVWLEVQLCSVQRMLGGRVDALLTTRVCVRGVGWERNRHVPEP